MLHAALASLPPQPTPQSDAAPAPAPAAAADERTAKPGDDAEGFDALVAALLAGTVIPITPAPAQAPAPTSQPLAVGEAQVSGLIAVNAPAIAARPDDPAAALAQANTPARGEAPATATPKAAFDQLLAKAEPGAQADEAPSEPVRPTPPKTLAPTSSAPASPAPASPAPAGQAPAPQVAAPATLPPASALAEAALTAKPAPQSIDATPEQPAEAGAETEPAAQSQSPLASAQTVKAKANTGAAPRLADAPDAAPAPQPDARAGKPAQETQAAEEPKARAAAPKLASAEAASARPRGADPAFTPAASQTPPTPTAQIAAHAAAPTNADPAAERPALHQQIATAIVQRAENGSTQFALRLDPPELGRVEIKLEVAADKTVRAMIAADQPQSLGELVRASRDIERALSDAGLKLANDGLSFDLSRNGGDARRDSLGQQQAQHQQQNADQRAGAWSRSAPPDPEPPAARFEPERGFANARAGRLDLVI